MEFTDSLKLNYEFRRAYRKGRSAAEPCLVVYARRNGKAGNRLGFTVSNKLGCAVVRNRVRAQAARNIPAEREPGFGRGHDVVVVARSRSVGADYQRLEREFLRACAELGLVKESET